MSEPPRLLEDPSELTDSARRLLVAGKEAAPPNTLGASVWADLAAKLPPAGPGGPSSQGGSSGISHGGGGPGAGLQSASVGALFKVALAVVGLSALVLGGRAMFFGHERAPLAKSVLPATETAPSLRRAESEGDGAPPAAEPASEVSAAAPSLVLHPSGPVHTGKATIGRAPPATSAAWDAREESRLVAAARDALRGGNAASALSLLAQARQRFGNGVLGQEREALLIEALAKSGQASAARSHGEAFLSNYARSPYAARIRSIIGDN